MTKALGKTAALIMLSSMATGVMPADDSATDIAGATGCGILATLLQNPQLQVAAGGACIYGTQVAKRAVAGLIDEHFDDIDQDFANKYCLTIVRTDGTRVEPETKQNCSE